MMNAGRILPPLMAVVAVSFFVGAALHLGLRVDVGATVLAEPRILVAAVVETACGVAMAVGAVGLAAGLPWGRAGALAGHLVALAGTALGIVANAFGPGPGSALNDAYHRVVVVALLVGLALLWRSGVDSRGGWRGDPVGP